MSEGLRKQLEGICEEAHVVLEWLELSEPPCEDDAACIIYFDEEPAGYLVGDDSMLRAIIDVARYEQDCKNFTRGGPIESGAQFVGARLGNDWYCCVCLDISFTYQVADQVMRYGGWVDLGAVYDSDSWVQHRACCRCGDRFDEGAVESGLLDSLFVIRTTGGMYGKLASGYGAFTEGCAES